MVFVLLICSLSLSTLTADATAGEANWDIMDHVFAPQWDSDGIRQVSKAGVITQRDTYVNVLKPESAPVGEASQYVWIVSPSDLSLPRDGFTMETTVRVAGAVNDEANEISIRMGNGSEDVNGQMVSVFMGYGKKGYISASANGTGDFVMELDTTVWHTITCYVYKNDNSHCFDLYVDGVLAFKSVPLITYKGADLVRFGADNNGRCNLDIKNVRLGAGAILPAGVVHGRFTDMTLSEAYQKESEEKKVTVSLSASDFTDGRAVSVSLLDSTEKEVNGATAVGTIKDGKAEITLMVPKGLSVGKYYVRAVSEDCSIAIDYSITVDRETPVFPVFTPVGFTMEMEDYNYNPTDEFNFPTVIDTKDHPVTNSMGDYRYYLFYAPHNLPAGCCMAASNSLDGPWVEYAENPLISSDWAGNYKVSHVSSPWVMWNDVYNCWFMYFHGENDVTRYATSHDLVNWTYGGVCVVANDFSTSGTGLNEASYARVFEHEIPGLGNKYIMLLMINGSSLGGHRNIYWAHSEDGKKWTAVKEALLDPTVDSIYQGNFSAPWFMELDGRYFVICHATSGDMYAFEVGENLDEKISWGVFYDSMDSANSNAEDESAYPDYGRSGAPCIIQDDDGNWHMFYEGGRRLRANIVHAVAHTHHYENGMCTGCGETDPEFVPVSSAGAGSGDGNSSWLWITIAVAGACVVVTGIAIMAIRKRKGSAV